MEKNFWKHKKVLVTGGTGFIGSHVVEKLVRRGALVTVLGSFGEGKEKNLKTVINDIRKIKGSCTDRDDAFIACKGQDVVMNLAARVGGIEYNKTHQATMLRDNLEIATVMMDAAKRADVERFLVVSSACIYPQSCSVPTPEAEGFIGEPEPATGGYGWAKRMAEKLGMYYAEEFGMKVGIVRPYNCYGPRGHLDPEKSHVVLALIKRVIDGENPVKVWGSGKQTRAFLFIEDLAEGMILAIERYPEPDPINLGTDEEVSIKELVNKIVKLSGVKSTIEFDTSKPDGSMRRNSDNAKAFEKIGFKAQVSLEEGLKQTIEWYKSEIHV